MQPKHWLMTFVVVIALAGPAGASDHSVVTLWAASSGQSWKKTWRPFRLGRLCVVDFEWRGALRPGDRRLVLEPGGAFGTGRHATTRLCLRQVQTRALAGARVVDCGTGSGILAVAACLLGAEEAFGFDVDPHALPYARALAQANGVDRRCRFVAGGFEAVAGEGGYHGLFANLYSDLLVAHARDMAALLAPGGWFVASGFTRDTATATRSALAAAGLPAAGGAARGRWEAVFGEFREGAARQGAP